MTSIWAFLHQSCAASVTALVILFLQWLFRDKLSPRWQYGIWWVLILRLVVPAGGRAVTGDLGWLIEQGRMAVEWDLSSAYAPLWSSGYPSAPIPWWNGAAPRSVTDVLFLVYLGGVIVTLIFFLASYGRLRLALRGAVPAGEGRMAQLRRTAEQYALPLPRRVVESEGIETPFLCGVFRPMLVLPLGRELDDKVLLHELLHLKYGDVAQGWLFTLFRCIHWCNPLLWLTFDKAAGDREALCDQRVLERLQGEERRDYGRILLSMADDRHLRTPGASTMANGGSGIKARIQAIARFKTFPRGMGLVSVCMALTLAASLIVGVPAGAVEGNTLPTDVHTRQEGIAALAKACNTRANTLAGALDCYAKSILYNNGVYRMAVTREADREALAAQLGWEEEPQDFTMYLDPSVWLSGGLPQGAARSANYDYLVFNPTETGDGYTFQLAFPYTTEDGMCGLVWETVEVTGSREEGFYVTPISRQEETFSQEMLDEVYNLAPIFLTYTGEVEGVELTLLVQQQVNIQDAAMEGWWPAPSFGYGRKTEYPDLSADFTGQYSYGGVTASNGSGSQISTLSVEVLNWMDGGTEDVGSLSSLPEGGVSSTGFHGQGGSGSSHEELSRLLCPETFTARVELNGTEYEITLSREVGA